MSNLQPSLIPLDKGLNLQTAKIVAPPGSVLDTLNYEQVDFQGQKRIDGFVRYDGNIVGAVKDYYRIKLDDDYNPSEFEPLVSTDDGLFGRVIVVGEEGDDSVIFVAIINETNIPDVGDTLYQIDGDGENVNGMEVLEVAPGAESGATVEEHYQMLLEFMRQHRQDTEVLPGPVVGLHWFRDRLYAVAGVVAVYTDDGTAEIVPNDMLATDGLAESGPKVLDSFAVGDNRVTYIAVMEPGIWASPDTDIFVVGNAVSVGTTVDPFDIPTDQQIATFYESRSEAQVLEDGDDDFGWRLIDLGWAVNFENGLSLYGGLPSLNQNISGIGTQGPTSITGDNGRALILTQGVSITDKPSQVNGWKSSLTPTTYNLDAETMDEVDSEYTYADAYISWNGVTGEVLAPGYTEEPIPEYPANNTVVVEITP